MSLILPLFFGFGAGYFAFELVKELKLNGANDNTEIYTAAMASSAVIAFLCVVFL